MKRKLLYILCLFILEIGISGKLITAKTIWDNSESVSVVNGGYVFFAHLSEDKKRSWIYQVEREKVPERIEISKLEFPKKIKNAPVTKIGGREEKDGDMILDIWGNYVEPYHEYDGYEKKPQGIKKVVLPSTVRTITRGAFCGMRSLVSIRIPEQVEQISYGTFYHCVNLRKVVLPKNLKVMDSDAFENCGKLRKFQMSEGSRIYSCVNGMILSKDGKRLLHVPAGKKKAKIPEGVETIKSRAFACTMAEKIWIPASVTSIQDLALAGNYIKKFHLADGNQRYAMSGDCIYSKKTRRLVAFISKKKTLRLPEEVWYLTKNISQAGAGRVKKLIIPKTFKKFKKDCFRGGIYLDSDAEIYFESKKPPETAENLLPDGIYYVPAGCVKKYRQWYYRTRKLTAQEKEYIHPEFKVMKS